MSVDEWKFIEISIRERLTLQIYTRNNNGSDDNNDDDGSDDDADDDNESDGVNLMTYIYDVQLS